MGQVASLQDDASEADMTDVAEERKYFEVKKIFVRSAQCWERIELIADWDTPVPPFLCHKDPAKDKLCPYGIRELRNN